MADEIARWTGIVREGPVATSRDFPLCEQAAALSLGYKIRAVGDE